RRRVVASHPRPTHRPPGPSSLATRERLEHTAGGGRRVHARLTGRSRIVLTRGVTTLDIEALKHKYAEERDKRLRPDGNAQYIQLKGQLSHYLDDPYMPVIEREPQTDHVTVAFIGGGFAGLVT